ncbi:MAG: metallophosphoesterase, partial [Lachnospiraceae bacterium]|nr:metallophosphoesterase [Lachnospiraceae bacterium]
TELLNRMEQAGVRHLDDECMVLTHKGAEWNLIGLDDASLMDNTLDKLMKEVDTKDFTLLLAHEPQYINKFSTYDIDLVLAGHAHGGQVRLPFIGGLVAPEQGFFPEYTEGVYKKNDTTMIVSRGLGNSIIPLRVFNYPEIVYIELGKESYIEKK